MIKLNRNITPLCLNPNNVNKLTEEFKENGTNVWNNEEIKYALMMLSNNKCAYCECDLSKESKYMEVEHFEDKKNNPDKVVVWDNLLPACKRCNGSKGIHDVLGEPIINPFLDNPRNHLVLKLYRFKGIDSIGKNTISVVNLNHTIRATSKRFDIGNSTLEALDLAIDSLSNYINDPTTRRKNKLINQVENLLREAQPQSEYGSTAATVLHGESKYHELKTELEKLMLWNNDLESLDNFSRGIAFI